MFKKIEHSNWEGNAFTAIGDEWLLITAKDGDKVNAMTASWGGLGVMWGKPAAYIFIRPQRHTYQLMENTDRFTLCIPGEEYRKALGYCGSHSGRDEDKLAACGLSSVEIDGIPAIEQSHTVLMCKKLYAQFLQEDCFIETSPIPRYYPEKDYHCMYIAEITDIYVKE
ncbi:MAG: flavin reductase family protein [Oscillospiraceae bacterium]|nr:flavin reductase family protein [Oscillospiraceae bacterium]MBQ9939598.1 flavin reductase family protein [Oscillospiraceae bacterium]